MCFFDSVIGNCKMLNKHPCTLHLNQSCSPHSSPSNTLLTMLCRVTNPLSSYVLASKPPDTQCLCMAPPPGAQPLRHLPRQCLATLAVSIGSLLWGTAIGWSATALPEMRRAGVQEGREGDWGGNISSPLTPYGGNISFPLLPWQGGLPVYDDVSASWVGSR